jgi:hypothetical protein
MGQIGRSLLERRRHPRISVGPQCRVRFQVGERCDANIPVANLGPTGCCIRIPQTVAVGLHDRATVPSLELIHPDLQDHAAPPASGKRTASYLCSSRLTGQ